MKTNIIRLMIAIVAVLTVSGCSAQSEKKESRQSSVNGDYVEVIYFYGKKRCATCVAIENLTQEVVENHFAEEMDAGKIIFRKIDLSTEDGEKMAYKYEVAWSSLFVNKIEGRKEKINNLTDFAFGNARTAPDKFKAGLSEKISEMLKD